MESYRRVGVNDSQNGGTGLFQDGEICEVLTVGMERVQNLKQSRL